MEYKENLETKEVEAELASFIKQVIRTGQPSIRDIMVSGVSLFEENVLDKYTIVEGNEEDGYGLCYFCEYRYYLVARLLGKVKYFGMFYADGTKWYFTRHENDKPHGIYKEWYPSGQLKHQSESSEGLKNGIFVWWYENGSLLATHTYKTGQSNGEAKTWNSSGILTSFRNYKDDRTDGLQMAWYDNGKPRFKEFWKNFSPDGPRRYWGADGMPFLQANEVGYFVGGNKVF